MAAVHVASRRRRRAAAHSLRIPSTAMALWRTTAHSGTIALSGTAIGAATGAAERSAVRPERAA
eukprot:CAMPEP_0195574908 /NCGR_PEP_ID=MMETSP0814-20130614/6254_1 /TAXON_ID=97485 /ORGANISM="Prymnesium parvum, Strain Texoma1" /LENGTH=63 /DNA_ID=CAMNT_0040710965 /DNA_START=325 /DNA_END=513 /DNA_ORIENTATION=-